MLRGFIKSTSNLLKQVLFHLFKDKTKIIYLFTRGKPIEFKLITPPNDEILKMNVLPNVKNKM